MLWNVNPACDCIIVSRRIVVLTNVDHGDKHHSNAFNPLDSQPSKIAHLTKLNCLLCRLIQEAVTFVEICGSQKNHQRFLAYLFWDTPFH